MKSLGKWNVNKLSVSIKLFVLSFTMTKIPSFFALVFSLTKKYPFVKYLELFYFSYYGCNEMNETLSINSIMLVIRIKTEMLPTVSIMLLIKIKMNIFLI